MRTSFVLPEDGPGRGFVREELMIVPRGTELPPAWDEIIYSGINYFLWTFSSCGGVPISNNQKWLKLVEIPRSWASLLSQGQKSQEWSNSKVKGHDTSQKMYSGMILFFLWNELVHFFEDVLLSQGKRRLQSQGQGRSGRNSFNSN